MAVYECGIEGDRKNTQGKQHVGRNDSGGKWQYHIGIQLEGPKKFFEIIHECTGIFALMIYFSCTIAYPTTWRHKIIGIAIGFPFILAMNLMRMIILVYIAGYHQDIFDYVHSYLWQGTFIIFVILLWFLWIEKVVK